MTPFETLEHTADLGIRAFGDTLEEVFAAAAMAVQAITLASGEVHPLAAHPITVDGDDLESLLVNWLNEVIYMVDGQRIMIARFDVKALTPAHLEAVAWGEEYDSTRHRLELVVKAATYHQLRLSDESGRWVAEVYLDI